MLVAKRVVQMDKAIVVENLTRIYKKGKESFFALNGLSLRGKSR
jgi:hypothetical protein